MRGIKEAAKSGHKLRTKSEELIKQHQIKSPTFRQVTKLISRFISVRV